MQAVELEEEKRLREQCQSLLAVAKNLFSHLGNLQQILRSNYWIFLIKRLALLCALTCFVAYYNARRKKSF